MGKNVSKKKINYGGMIDEAIVTTDTDTPTYTDTYTRNDEYTDTPAHTLTDTPTKPKKQKMRATPEIPSQRPKYAPAHIPTFGEGERKTERLQLLVKPSTKSRLAEYARDHGTSSNEVVQRLVDALLDDEGY